MSFDYQAAKAAIKNAGHTVSAGNQVLATDIKEIVKFGRRVFGLSDVAVNRGIANPALLPEGFPGTSAASVAPAPVEAVETPAPAVEAPAQEAAPVEDATKGKKSKKAADAPAETAQDAPATDAPAQDAPAAEQAAQ